MVKPDETVVCLCTGNGLKDVASARRAAGEPVAVDATWMPPWRQPRGGVENIA